MRTLKKFDAFPPTLTHFLSDVGLVDIFYLYTQPTVAAYKTAVNNQAKKENDAATPTATTLFNNLKQDTTTFKQLQNLNINYITVNDKKFYITNLKKVSNNSQFNSLDAKTKTELQVLAKHQVTFATLKPLIITKFNATPKGKATT